MKLYFISQSVNGGYDTYDGAVVCAKNEEEARDIIPGGGTYSKREAREKAYPDEYQYPIYDWAYNKEDVVVKYIGSAVKGFKKSVICASFNAG